MELVPFSFNGHGVRVVVDEATGKEWFIAKDILEVLDIKNIADALKGLDSDELTSVKAISGGQNRTMKAVDESGLFTLIIRSNKPEAKPFRKWVTGEVLPQIRKTGSYQIGQPKPKIDYPDKVKAEMILIEGLSSMLKMDDNSKLLLVHNVAKNNNIDIAILPQYTENVKVHHAATHLLDDMGIQISAVKFNEKLHEHGLIDKKWRKKRDGTEKSFWSITNKGERYGINQSSPYNPNETIAHWYDDLFAELITLVIGEDVA